MESVGFFKFTGILSSHRKAIYENYMNTMNHRVTDQISNHGGCPASNLDVSNFSKNIRDFYNALKIR